MSRKYRCGYGCTSYNPNCDACDSETSSAESGRYYVSEEDKERAHKRAVQGLSPWDFDDNEDEE